MRFSTPMSIAPAFYAGIDTAAGRDEELLGFSLGRLYVGIYPTSTGFDLAVGILDANGCLD
jgi:hypothetical protein